MRSNHSRPVVTGVTPLMGALIGFGCSQSTRQGDVTAKAADAEKVEKVARFGSVIGLRPEKKDEYVKLHAETWPAVLDMICKCNIRNYSIYLTQFEGKLYLFSYFEYTGDDFQADVKLMAEDATTKKWWKVTDPCQIRLPGTPDGEQWLKIEEVFHTD